MDHGERDGADAEGADRFWHQDREQLVLKTIMTPTVIRRLDRLKTTTSINQMFKSPADGVQEKKLSLRKVYNRNRRSD